MMHIASTAVVWLGLRKRADSPTGAISASPVAPYLFAGPALSSGNASVYGFIRQSLYPI
jgi:hypothetical protein